MNHKNVQQEQTTHNSLYWLTISELQLNYDLEGPHRTDEWKSTNNHKGELVIAYNNKGGNKTLRLRVFYALNSMPNNIGNRHLICRLSTDQILVTNKYQSVHMPEDLIEAKS